MSIATEPIPIAFEGRTLLARPGQSLAALLTGAGVLALRETPTGAARGIFCGMGVCQECLVVVDGVPNQRACMLKITRPLMVAPQTASTAPFEAEGRAPVALADGSPRGASRPPGAGGGRRGAGGWPCPGLRGGLARGSAAGRAGHAPGASCYQKAEVLAVGWAGDPLDSQQAAGQRLVEAVARSGVVVVPECEVWGAFPADDAAADILAMDQTASVGSALLGSWLQRVRMSGRCRCRAGLCRG